MNREDLNRHIADMLSELTEEQYIDFLFALQDILCPAETP